MNGTGILLVGVLVLVAVLVITTTIIALAPYIASAIVLAVLVWFFLKWESQDSTSDEPPN